MRIAGTVLVLLLAACGTSAQEATPSYVIDTRDLRYLENFSGFTGSFESLPAGFSISLDGSNEMTNNHPDFRGISQGQVNTGGCYAWTTGDGNTALGWQPTSTKFTPGWFGIKILNTTPGIIRSIEIGYRVVYLNNENRANSLKLAFSLDGSNYSDIAGSSFQTPEIAEQTPAWQSCDFSFNIALTQPYRSGSCFYFRWLLDDAGGSLWRDEYGIDDIMISLRRPPGTVIRLE